MPRKIFSFRLDHDLVAGLDRYCAARDLTRAEVVRSAIEALIGHGKPDGAQPVTSGGGTRV
ncbi:ribbon-helix-helix protein, CopG family [Sulfitobacter sp. KE29]|nr:ribbon-helix-helix protein, CopG family [Sulfitobacter sp. R18_2]MDF3419104.1 ribbon-helix-helix protein, CopG family [Sulfitobacter sp. Ks38]MDF3426586.1 ribbon-helix-helix protein, CopG family [Sulfitobacter sp. KE29]MDF3430167.1 ribbon-helix-helix protein, CopG family [Sulfitobacter sp. S46]MDF3444939.1 ribbon-helix-helix protein, CopG family [Sulfitobacter sp. KE31]MDF3548964.1 ribbon-helix-helix protein, CopG family [Sulfitobacter sp. KE28]